MKVKICGVCRPEDAAAADRLGADYVGVILAPDRRRSQSLSAALAIFAEVQHARRVGVFIDPSAGEIEAALGALRLDVVQLHGSESPQLAREIGSACPVWKAVTVADAGHLVDALSTFSGAVDAVVLDHGMGGTGESFDWTEAASLREQFPPALTIVAAGGLTPGNVAAAIQTLRPDIVDVSSGVESAPAVKSAALIKDFIWNARNA